jgi:hypothetical protein
MVVEAYGARLAISAPNHELLRRVVAGLPRGWDVPAEAVRPADVEWRFDVLHDASGYRVRDGDGHERPCVDLELAIWMLRTEIRRFVGYHTPDLVFIHAGVVAQMNRAVVLPGHSFAGKSRLVEALVRRGAEYYSDEYAMIDKSGLVAQYREPLAIRTPEGKEELDVSPEVTQPRVRVGLVAFAMYMPGAVWSPRQLTSGEGLVTAMQHTVPARDRPAETLATLKLAFADAMILQGDRGEADETAAALLETLSALPS